MPFIQPMSWNSGQKPSVLRMREGPEAERRHQKLRGRGGGLSDSSDSSLSHARALSLSPLSHSLPLPLSPCIASVDKRTGTPGHGCRAGLAGPWLDSESAAKTW